MQKRRKGWSGSKKQKRKAAARAAARGTVFAFQKVGRRSGMEIVRATGGFPGWRSAARN